ncbi:MAG TPA: acyltransferase [Gemmatimonadales bacterium]|nr:acyltransferase [Gemmatimonadales bacterium]
MNRFASHLEARHLPALDGLRAIAVGTVITYHAGMWGVPADLGVSAFFVLSGFLITWLLLKEFQNTQDVSLRRFYLRRTLRIFPAYYAFLVLSYAIDRLHGAPWDPAYAASAAGYVVNYYNALHGEPITSITHAWSLGVEEQFYLLWPLLFLFLMRRGIARARTVLVIVIALVAVWRSWLYLRTGVGSAWVNNAFDTRADNLAVGCLLALSAGMARFERWAAWSAASPAAPLVTLGLLWASRIDSAKAYHYSIGYTIDALLLAILVVQLIQLSQHGVWSWLNWRWVRFLGTLSYSLYLYHNWGLTAGRHVPGGELGTFLAGVAGALALAGCSYFGIERPFLALRDRLERRFWPKHGRSTIASAGALPATLRSSSTR